MKVPLAICNLYNTPFDSSIDMDIVGRVGQDKNKKFIVVNPETNRLYEESGFFVKNHRLPKEQFDRFRVTIRPKYQERFEQEEYAVIGYSRDGRVTLEDRNGDFIPTYVSRLLFKEYEYPVKDL